MDLLVQLDMAFDKINTAEAVGYVNERSPHVLVPT